MMSKKQYNNMTTAEQSGEDFMSKNWRPMMAMTYMLTCLFDFVAGPILYNLLQFYNPGQDLAMWQPLTLQGGGLYHIAMGVVLGITAHGRTQEKINGVDSIPSIPSLPNLGGMISQPTQNEVPVNQPVQQSFVPPSQSFPVPNFPTPVSEGKFGKIVPPAEDPIL